MRESGRNGINQTKEEKWNFPFSKEEWAATPKPVQDFLLHVVASHATLEKRIEKIETSLNKNSSNSNKPPSSDNPFKEKPKKEKKKKNKKKRRKGYKQKMLDPTKVENVLPEACTCGNICFNDTQPYYTYQVIELPEIEMKVTHFVLYKGECPCCGKVNKAVVPKEHRTGFGPRLSAMIAEMAGNQGDSRTIIQDFCSSVLGFHISLGAIQKVIDRASEAIKPHYEVFGEEARQTSVNHIDETSHRQKGKLEPHTSKSLHKAK